MKKAGRPKTDRKEIAEKLKEIEKNYVNKKITQEFCAEKLGITHRTFCNIIKKSFQFSYLEVEQFPETPSDPYVSMMYVPSPGKLYVMGPVHGEAAHEKFLCKAVELKKKQYKVYLFTASQLKKGYEFTPHISELDNEIRAFAIRHGWGQKKARN